jgi:hypothetical protein
VVRLYGLRNWVEQGYKQVKHELGWADFMVRSDRAIRRHWQLVCCAFSFCWQAWFAEEARLAPTLTPAPRAEASASVNSAVVAGQPAGRGKMETDSRPTSTPATTWPMTLRRVRARSMDLPRLDPWTCLWRWWRAWSTAPPPPAIQALLHAVGTGQPL